jgi:hypothetical protein
MCAQPTGLLKVTVIVRWVPLVTAAYGTRMAWPARTSRLAPGALGSQLAQRLRPSDDGIVGKSPEGSRQARW